MMKVHACWRIFTKIMFMDSTRISPATFPLSFAKNQPFTYVFSYSAFTVYLSMLQLSELAQIFTVTSKQPHGLTSVQGQYDQINIRLRLHQRVAHRKCQGLSQQEGDKSTCCSLSPSCRSTNTSYNPQCSPVEPISESQTQQAASSFRQSERGCSEAFVTPAQRDVYPDKCKPESHYK